MLTVLDATYPQGELLDAMFPDKSLQTNATIWLGEAVGKTSNEEAQKHWVYYRGFTAFANRLATEPNSVGTFGEIQRQIGGDRIKDARTKAEQHRAEFDRISETESFLDEKPAKVRVF